MSEQIDPADHANPARRGPMPMSLRLFGAVAIFIITFITVGSIYDVFQTKGKPLNTLSPEGPLAASIQGLVRPVFIVAGVVFVLVLVGVLIITRVFREKPGDDDQDFVHQTEGNTVLEIAWTSVSATSVSPARSARPR